MSLIGRARLAFHGKRFIGVLAVAGLDAGSRPSGSCGGHRGAFLWYEQQRPGLGADFLRTVDGALAVARLMANHVASAAGKMKGPARGRGLGARLSGRRLAGRLLHPRGRTATSLLGKRPGIPTRCRESHCCCRGGGGPRRLALNLALCARESMPQSAWSLIRIRRADVLSCA